MPNYFKEVTCLFSNKTPGFSLSYKFVYYDPQIKHTCMTPKLHDSASLSIPMGVK